MPSETDPLLPQGNSAPEITGYGFSKPSNDRYDLYDEPDGTYQAPQEDEHPPDYDEYVRRVETGSQISGTASSVGTLCSLFAIVVGVALVIALLMPGLLEKIWDPSDWSPPWGPSRPSTIPARVDKIMKTTPLIDGHNDLAIAITSAYHNKIYEKNFTTAFENGGMVQHVDLPRLKAGKVGGTFWSAFTPCLARGTDDFNEPANHARSVATTLSQLDLLNRLTSTYATTFASPLLNSTAALSAFRDHHLLISPSGIEGLHQIGNSYSNLRLYHSLGVKYATLTHNCYNAYADPALLQAADWTLKAAPAHWHGLSPAGTTLVQEMNRMGMLVDLAHVSKDTMRDVLGGNPAKTAGSAAPVLFSHSSAHALCPHPRNVPDDILQLVKRTNSLVMVNFAPDFISCLPAPGDSLTGLPVFYPANATLHQVARHIVYIGDLIGYAHVGIGSDFDGIPNTSTGLEDVSKFPDLIAELLEMGVSDADAAKVVGGNVLRVWGEAEKVAARMQREGVLPAEDDMNLLG